MDQWPDNVMRHGLVLVVTTVAAFWRLFGWRWR